MNGLTKAERKWAAWMREDVAREAKNVRNFNDAMTIFLVLSLVILVVVAVVLR